MKPIVKRPRRTEYISARVTKEVKRELERRARRVGMTLSEYVEQSLFVMSGLKKSEQHGVTTLTDIR